MGSLMKIVVLLYVTSAVLCTPFINQLQPGQEWPTRSSVKQPKPDESQKVTDGVVKETEDAIEVDKAPEAISELKVTPEKKVDYSGCQVWKVTTTHTGAKKVISQLASEKLISSWGGNHSTVDVLVKPKVIENVTSVLNSKNIPYDIVIEDLQQVINEENPPLDENEIELQDRRGHRMTWKQYHRVEDIHGFMDYLAKTYPSLVSVNTIGKSVEGRDLKVLRISDGKPTNKAIFIDGGIHAREWISPAVVTYFINQFAENFDVESDDIKNIDWYFLPVVNPDGYEYTHTTDRLWRKNRRRYSVCVGTDLNRNFGYHWGGKGASNSPCRDIYRGAAAFSEPESKAIADFVGSIATKFSAYLTYHSYGQYLLYPWGYDNVVPPDYKELQAVGEQIAGAIKKTGGSSYSVGSSSGLLYPASGGSDDWAKSQGIKYSYTIELSDTGRYGFVLPASKIEPVARENLAGLRVLAHQVCKE
ncbi:carboxypeptidase B-like [Anticarsia gemmatalis]|uniref:carboxypeptidase B-like n=1 Tax=Anticarsia gemmatalis TaxID=129554 RepID=UPI003F763494